MAPSSTTGKTAPANWSGKTEPTNCAGAMPTGRRQRPLAVATAPCSRRASRCCARRTAAAPPRLLRPPPPPAASKVTFAADAFFDFDKAVLKPEGRAKLDDLVSKIRDVNLEVIIAVGHTDSIGTDAYNQKPVGASCRSCQGLPGREGHRNAIASTPKARAEATCGGQPHRGRPREEPSCGNRSGRHPRQS